MIITEVTNLFWLNCKNGDIYKYEDISEPKTVRSTSILLEIHSRQPDNQTSIVGWVLLMSSG